MDVRDLAPALLAVGQLFDAANTVLNRDQATVKISVTATGQGSFEISFDVLQNIASQITSFFAGEHIVGALNLREIVVGGSLGLIWLIRKLQGRKPDRVERLSDSHVRITIGSESFDVPLALVRLYQDLAVRAAAQKVVADPLRREGIDTFEVRENKQRVLVVKKLEAEYFEKPELPPETLVETTRRTAFSIISLAFKEDNKWRLYDGNTQISALIEDEAFLARVNANLIAFAKGDILICDCALHNNKQAKV